MSPSDVPSCPWCGSDSHYATNSVGCPVKFDERVSMPSPMAGDTERLLEIGALTAQLEQERANTTTLGAKLRGEG